MMHMIMAKHRACKPEAGFCNPARYWIGLRADEDNKSIT